MPYQSINPNNGKTIKTFEYIDKSQLENSLATAESCFQTWKHTSYQERASIVNRAAKLMHANVDDFAKLATLEMGKRIDEARGEVNFSADILAYYADHAERFLQSVTLNPKVGKAHMECSPLGVLFCVEPWNFPYYQLARVAGPQLMAGNVVVVKHAACVPQCAIAFEKLWIDAGAPVGAYTNLLITHEQSEEVIDDPRIKGVALTGSVAAGRSVAARAGLNLKKTSMELGGSDAFIVLEDADIEKTIPWAVWGRMYNGGQTCCAAKRFIVLDSIADEFLEKFSSALSALKPGDPLDQATTHAPLSTEAALLQLIKQVDIAVKHGARLVMGGKRLKHAGYFMEITILTDIQADNPAFRDEFFGPVVCFYRVKDEAAAIALANDSDFGLGGSVFTKDIARGRRVASQVDTGMMFINNIDWADAELPFGGIKYSGYGRELGNLGIQEFVNKKLVRITDQVAPN
ncbi:NAD-dependent succinate-semialdehyde dehydrogenase [Undibacterium sp. Di24W]|uniref:NAD-dependent succinate-semialdehyde dehydrogenase n=1 Tax=Undibacterium sp. Di24W TaxID=3413033 RepID=UPI003BF2FCD5